MDNIKFDVREAVYNLSEKTGIGVKLIGKEYSFARCPYCNEKSDVKQKKFSINADTGQFHCFRASCEASGNLIRLAQDFNFSLGRDADVYYGIGNQRHYRVFKKIDPIEPKDAAIEYMKSRGIKEDIVRKYQITANEDGNIVFPFLDEKSQMQFVKYRNPAPKEGENKEWCERNCKPILFGMAQCNLDNKTLVITEGQIDSLSVAQAGIENAVSVPTGAKGFTWVPHCWDWLHNFNKIVVFGDHENGTITLFNELADRLKYRVWHVRVEDYKDCKDANEILNKYGPEQIKRCVYGAEQLPISKAISLSKVENVNPYMLEKLSTGLEYPDKVLCGGLPFGQLILLTGKAGDGKSTLASQLLLSALQNNYKCFAYSGELPNYLFKSWIDFQAAGTKNTYEQWAKWQYDQKPRAIKEDALQKIVEWYKDRIWLYDNTNFTENEDDTLSALLEQVINQYGVRVILIDNLMTAMDLEKGLGHDKYEKQSLFVKKMARIALEYNVLIILVAHKRKDNGFTEVNESVSGSLDIINLASIVLSYERPTKKMLENDSSITKDDRILKITKNRLFGRIDNYGTVTKYDFASKRIYTNEVELQRNYGWNDELKEPEEETAPPWEDE